MHLSLEKKARSSSEKETDKRIHQAILSLATWYNDETPYDGISLIEIRNVQNNLYHKVYP